MSKTDNFIFIFLQVVAWIIFVGLCINAGALIVNFVVSIIKPDFVRNLYLKLDLSNIRQYNDWMYYGVYGFLLFVGIMKAHLFYNVAMLVTKFDMSNPFNAYVSEKIAQISYTTFTIGLLSLIAADVTKYVSKYGIDTMTLNKYWEDGQAYILMAAVIYIISRIFRKGIELQTENDLTI